MIQSALLAYQLNFTDISWLRKLRFNLWAFWKQSIPSASVLRLSCIQTLSERYYGCKNRHIIISEHPLSEMRSFIHASILLFLSMIKPSRLSECVWTHESRRTDADGMHCFQKARKLNLSFLSHEISLQVSRGYFYGSTNITTCSCCYVLRTAEKAKL